MTTRHKAIILLGSAVLLLGLRWMARDSSGPSTFNGQLSATIAPQSPAEPPESEIVASVAPEPIATLTSPAKLGVLATREEAAEWLKSAYRKEQLARELAFEQLRYGRHYWESEANGATLAQIQQARAALLRQLNAEANQVLAEAFPDEVGEPIILTEIFNDDHPGPNVSFLAPASHQQFEELAAAAIIDGPLDAGRLLEIARQTLPAAQFEHYLAWNSPPAAALRHQLVGFASSEGEFQSILKANRSEEGAEEPAARAVLERELGPNRYAEYRQLIEPSLRTAINDLHRLGLPIEHAGALAELRNQATGSMQHIWSSEALAEFTKAGEVSRVQSVFRGEIALRLSSNARSLDADDLLP